MPDRLGEASKCVCGVEGHQRFFPETSILGLERQCRKAQNRVCPQYLELCVVWSVVQHPFSKTNFYSFGMDIIVDIMLIKHLLIDIESDFVNE